VNQIKNNYFVIAVYVMQFVEGLNLSFSNSAGLIYGCLRWQTICRRRPG